MEGEKNVRKKREMRYRSVRSSTIVAVGYDKLTKTLGVIFRGGATYHLTGVPEKHHQALMEQSRRTTGSIGGYYQKFLRDEYPTVRVDQEPIEALSRAGQTLIDELTSFMEATPGLAEQLDWRRFRLWSHVYDPKAPTREAAEEQPRVVSREAWLVAEFAHRCGEERHLSWPATAAEIRRVMGEGDGEPDEGGGAGGGGGVRGDVRKGGDAAEAVQPSSPRPPAGVPGHDPDGDDGGGAPALRRDEDVLLRSDELLVGSLLGRRG